MLNESMGEAIMVQSARIRVLFVTVLGITLTLIAVWLVQKRYGYSTNTSAIAPSVVIPQPQASAPRPSDIATPNPDSSLPLKSSLSSLGIDPRAEPTPTPQNPTPVVTLDPNYAVRLNLAIPVKGVKKEQLHDTFKDARSEGRVHDAIDIPAPAGTPVIAVAEGEIIKLFESERGGTTIYQLSKDKKLIFYYAHLQRYADGLVVGKTVWQGETIGYVGDTGNAGAGNYHLHFSIMITNNPKRYWEGTNINPYPLLRK